MSRPEAHYLSSSRGCLIYTRQLLVRTAPERVFAVVESIGGKHGWLFANFLWQMRGAMDRALGGVGMSRGRRDPESLRVADVVDFWHVEALHRDHFLRFAADMKLPGAAWLQFELEPTEDGTLLRSQALFKPNGIWGQVYWGLMYPAHVFIFSGLLRAIAKQAERRPAASLVAGQAPKI